MNIYSPVSSWWLFCSCWISCFTLKCHIASELEIHRNIVRYVKFATCLSLKIRTLWDMLSVFFPPAYNNEDSGLSRSVSMATGLNHIDTRPKVRTIFPHKSGNNTTLLSFEEGDIISLLIPDERDGWLYGELQKNKQWVELVNVCHLWAFHTKAGSRRHVYSLVDNDNSN